MQRLFALLWDLESKRQQWLHWEDAAKARIARDRAEASAKAQADAMYDAAPSGRLGASQLDDENALRRAGLL
jgi:hypothetical protein